MIIQGVIQQRIFIYCFVLHVITSVLIGSTSSAGQDLASNFKAAQTRESENAPLPSDSTHPTSEIVKPSLIRNRRSNSISENEHLYGKNADLDSAFLYNDQIMQNLLNSPTSKPLSYAHSNFFLNFLKPRTTRYNPWDDHSLMHFGKRSLKDDIVTDKVIVKRSADVWLPNNVLHFGKKSENIQKGNESPENTFNTEIDTFDTDETFETKNPDISDSDLEKDYPQIDNSKKSADPWHSMMSFGKKSQNPWDHNTLHFGKKDEPWHNMMSFGKKADPWHSMMSFGKRADPWHSMMSFGKKADPWHSMMSFGKKADPWHSMMSFGKKSQNPWDHNTLHFGKKDEPWHNMMSFGKKSDPWHSMLSFGKRSDSSWDHNTLNFGKKDEPWHNIMSFGKRYENLWDHNTLHFGKRTPWDHDTLHFGKRDPWDHNTLHFGKRDDPWHGIMSFGKKSENFDVPDLEKREDPWHNMMSFGKKSDNSDMNVLEKRDDPWHNMMSFGKKSDNLFNNNTPMVDKRNEPWHSMMSFGKKADNNFDHSTMHFGKREEPWHNMMSFGKKSSNDWDHNTLHFGKRDELSHSMMSFGKKSDTLTDKDNSLDGREYKPWSNNMMTFEKRPSRLMDDLSEDFLRNGEPWYEYNGMVFYKRSNPWDHNTLHFGKKSNTTQESSLETEDENSNHIQKRSADMWNDHHTMHFGKKFDPWDNHNTMHFGKKSDLLENQNAKNFEHEKNYNSLDEIENIDKRFDWDSHNTMHFGKRDPEDYRNTFLFEKRDPWDYHNTMHFGKRDPWDYHNTMHFGKRDSWDYHNTMHFGKRNPWEHHNTMHFGKRSNPNMEDDSVSSTDKSIDKTEAKISDMKDTKNILDRKTSEKGLSSKIRPSLNAKINEGPENVKIQKETFDQSPSNTKFLQKSHNLNRLEENFETTLAAKSKDADIKSKLKDNSPSMINSLESKTRKTSEEKSHIRKRSVNPNYFIKNINEDSNADLGNKYPADEISESGKLHFGKRSIEVPNENEEQWFDVGSEKRFDDLFNNHNTLHFGKKSSPIETYSVIPPLKRDPWEYLNTLHFGKKFDPWDGHAKMHFGKRSDDWNHNVMHFGKRRELTREELEVLSGLEDFDPIKLQDYIQSINVDQDDSAENDDFLDNLVILKSLISSYSQDNTIPFEERVNHLRYYLRPIIKAMIDAERSEFVPVIEYNADANERIKDYNEGAEDRFQETRVIPFKTVNAIKKEEAIFNKGNDDSSYGEYGDKYEQADNTNESQNLVKSKRKYIGKAELKRYFVPFEGPKSIVYPHAWFASQIRRSSLPRTTDYARHMEMRMAEKKEDPFNSYMHFGRR